ncbi:MAG: type sorting protein, partial [Bacteroidota bacterium]|nr:type sorting protein [Bacteroidota bacterium]
MMKNFKVYAALLVMIGAFLTINTANAQLQRITDMTFSQGNSTYQPISGNFWSYVGAADDNVYTFTLPFSFAFDGYSTNLIYMSANGYLALYPYGNYSYYSAYNINQLYASICAMRRDLYIRQGMYVDIQGVAPNRVAIFQWSGNDFYYSYSANMNFQIKLFETSNIPYIIYGSMNQGSYVFNSSDSYYYTWAHIGFSSRDYNGSYINVKPLSGGWKAYNSAKPDPTIPLGPVYYYGSVRSSTDFALCTEGKWIQLTAYPSMTDVYPRNGVVLARGLQYTGAQHPAVWVNRIAGQQDVYFKYKITGPLPKSNPACTMIYQATQIGNINNDLANLWRQPVGNPDSVHFVYATGIAARTNPKNDGALDLQTNQYSIPGGQYMVESSMIIPSAGNYTVGFPDQLFNIALLNDLAVHSIVSPKTKDKMKYALSQGRISISAKLINLGINDITQFYTIAEIRKSTTNALVYRDSLGSADRLTIAQFFSADFALFQPDGVGDFKLKIYCNLLSAIDQARENDTIPLWEDTYEFNVAYEFEAEASQILAPVGSIYVGRPVKPVCRFLNNGVSELPEPCPGYCEIYFGSDTVYRSTVQIQDLPAGRLNWADIAYDDFVPQTAGNYQVCAWIESPDDPRGDNNRVCGNFTVVHALAGLYTVGTKYAGQANNFNTIQDAVDALYLQGVTGAVTFELTDALYEVGNYTNLAAPALDISSKIVGINQTNTITWRPSQERGAIRSGIQINLNSGNGTGILFGQSSNPFNNNAPVKSVNESLKRQYSNPNGYMIFDGGTQKSLLFTLKLNPTRYPDYRIVFNFSNGSSNYTVKNCLIQDGINQAVSNHINLPHSNYNASQSRFEYEKDLRDDGRTFSAGILFRSTVPLDQKTESNYLLLDTLTNNNNLIYNNEINGFGYGIVSIGIGCLYYANESIPFANYKRYYNTGNIFSNNMIHDVVRSGIFMGFEDNTKAIANRIYHVTGANNVDAAGIIAGGDDIPDWFGYNNIDLTIARNEISDVNSNVDVYGVKVQQNQIAFQTGSIDEPIVSFPDKPEGTKIINNIVWGLKPIAATTNIFGIRLFTQRNEENSFIDPLYPEYFTSNDKIANNTIILDNDIQQNAGYMACIAIQHTKNAEVKNNAMSIEDYNVAPTDDIVACILYEGVHPKEGGLTSDRNAFWLGNSGGSLIRFIETDWESVLISGGERNEFDLLQQWQSWTLQDQNSIVGNFSDNFIKLGIKPQNLRVMTQPETPIGSILNNRGDRLSFITEDIDGQERGLGNKRYDIGADEFDGRMYINDLEMLSFPYPAAYRANTGSYSDAEYIMTTSPVDIKINVRNNGSIAQNDFDVILNVYQENPDGTFASTALLTDTVKASVQSGENSEVSFK